MGKMIAYGNEVTNVFQLIGTLENDITKSITWALCKCPIFMKNIIYEIFNIDVNADNIEIIYQNFEKDKGITDIEITDNDSFFVIFEAKRGWILPSAEQLTLYSERKGITQSGAKNKAIISMSECSEEYANSYLPFNIINGIPVRHLSWKKIYELAKKSLINSSYLQKNILKELIEYLGGIMTIQEKESNWVYVVSIGMGCPDNCKLTWIDFVEKHRKYFHPIGGGKGGWPKTPPNYIGFRYNGQLQSIHHIEDYVVTRNLHNQFEEMPDELCETDHFVYNLGPAIRPMHTVKTGNIYASGRVWAMLDTLLIADTIADARDISKSRMRN